MVDIADRQEKAAAKEETAERKPLPRWMITVASVTILLIVSILFSALLVVRIAYLMHT